MLKMTELSRWIGTVGRRLSVENRLSFGSSCPRFLEEKADSKPFQGITAFFL